MPTTPGMIAGEQIQALASKPKPFTREDLQEIRENIHGVHLAPQPKAVDARLTVELIDAIAVLDQSSSKLMKAANRLTLVILILTAVTVLFSALQIYLMIRH